jgi:hypothetical protein
MFTPEAFLARVHAEPFVPFRVVTSSGEAYDVGHPELVLVGDRFLEIGIPKKPASLIAHQIFRVALIHVTVVNDLPVPAAGGTNGPA